MKTFIISERLTDEEYFNKVLSKSQSKASVNLAKNGITSFHRFTQNVYGMNHNQMINELYAEYQKNNDSGIGATAKTLAEFFYWLMKDHPDIIIGSGIKYGIKRPLRKISSTTAKGVINHVRAYIRSVGGIKITSEDLRDVLTIPIEQKDEDPYAMTLEEIMKIVDSTTKLSRKVKYLVIRDTGMRSSESMQFTKKMITFNVEDSQYAKIRLSSQIVKGKSKARDNYLTPDVAKKLYEISKDLKDDQPIFWTLLAKDENDLLAVNNNEARAMDRDRTRLAEKFPEFGNKYEHSGYHKISLHAIRAFTATAITKGNNNNEDIGHGYIGHKKYLDQYIRKSDSEKLQIFKNAEPFITGVKKEYGPDELSQQVKGLRDENKLLNRQISDLKTTSQKSVKSKVDNSSKWKFVIDELLKTGALDSAELLEIMARAPVFNQSD
ncbi:MAG: hypothetical protein O3C48_08480 [Crenarchaeota archaeon]|nr:hypothetical protein [Thermoproteota archaeon]